jgi:hypothetical protein
MCSSDHVTHLFLKARHACAQPYGLKVQLGTQHRHKNCRIKCAIKIYSCCDRLETPWPLNAHMTCAHKSCRPRTHSHQHTAAAAAAAHEGSSATSRTVCMSVPHMCRVRSACCGAGRAAAEDPVLLHHCCCLGGLGHTGGVAQPLIAWCGHKCVCVCDGIQ